MNKELDQLCINAIRMTSMHCINKAKSGHPGICLGAAPIMHTLFTRHLNIDPKVPEWVNRDRFIMSAGHGSAMLYSTLHLAGFNISMNDLKNFRKFGSKTPGHPEVFHTDGVEATTGPLGQGISMGVGMAIAADILAGKFNKFDKKLFDNYTYVLVGDGDLQEGVCQEALSLAGTLELRKLIVLYDSNDIQLDGEVALCNKEVVKDKYEAMGFDYILVEDGNDVEAIDDAITKAKNSFKPSLIEVKTVIGYGTNQEGDCSIHGAPLGDEATYELAQNLEWEFKEFEIPKSVYDFYNENVALKGANLNSEFNVMISEYEKAYPKQYEELVDFLNNDYKIDSSKLKKYNAGTKEATRNVTGYAISQISEQLPFVVGGCADLIKTTKARGANGNYGPDNKTGRNILFGVREFAMAAIANGITLYHSFVGFSGGFLVFSDYMKPAIRLAALMEIPAVYTFSHDSIAVGEDGPTHQPIEQLTMLRSIPNFNCMRPCDANETMFAYKVAFESKKTPTCIVTTRQEVMIQENTNFSNVKRGGYIIRKENAKTPTAVIIAAGSEVELAINTAIELEKDKIFVRVVSMPSMFLFDKQDAKYKETIIDESVPVIAVEMAHPMSWYKYTKNVYGVDTYGASGPAKDVMNKYGFTVDAFKDYCSAIIKK